MSRRGHSREDFLATAGARIGRLGASAVVVVEELAEVVVAGAPSVKHRGDDLS